MTASQTLGAALDALLRAGDKTAKDAARATGIDDATISKFRTGLRWPKTKHWDALSRYFEVEPYVLLKPDEALSPTLRHDQQAKAHKGVAGSSGNALGSPSPTFEGGAALLRHPDQELLSALLAFWDVLTPEGRLELVGHGHRLRTAAVPPTAAGFKVG